MNLTIEEWFRDLERLSRNGTVTVQMLDGVKHGYRLSSSHLYPACFELDDLEYYDLPTVTLGYQFYSLYLLQTTGCAINQ